jgi:hypothetical protein
MRLVVITARSLSTWGFPNAVVDFAGASLQKKDHASEFARISMQCACARLTTQFSRSRGNTGLLMAQSMVMID